jgi:hypothetical protein
MCSKRENQVYKRACPRDKCEDVGRKDEGGCAARKERRGEMGRMDSRKVGMTKARGMHADKSVLRKEQRRTEIITHLTAQPKHILIIFPTITANAMRCAASGGAAVTGTWMRCRGAAC